MATMQMYCPSLKKTVEATITDGKQVRSKGGSFRMIIYGEYKGKKCLPKTVKAEVFAQHGFEAEAVPIGNVEGDGLLAVMDGVGEHKGFIELEDDDEDEDSVEIGISDEEMNEIAEIKLGAETFDAGWVITHPNGLRTDSFRTKSQAEKYRDELKQNPSLRTGLRIVKANANDEPMTVDILNKYGAETFEGEGEYHLNGEGCEYCSEERELNAEGYCSECVSYAESYSSESILNPSKMSKEGKLALGLTAIGIGLAMFKANKIAEWFNKR